VALLGMAGFSPRVKILCGRALGRVSFKEHHDPSAWVLEFPPPQQLTKERNTPSLRKGFPARALRSTSNKRPTCDLGTKKELALTHPRRGERELISGFISQFFPESCKVFSGRDPPVGR